METISDLAHELLTGETVLGYSRATKQHFFNRDVYWHGDKDIFETVMVGLYSTGGGTSGEIELEWEMLSTHSAIRLKAFDDAWQMFALIPTFFEMLSQSGTLTNRDAISPEAMIAQLDRLGFRDLTDYRPNQNEYPSQKRAYGEIPQHLRRFFAPWTHFASVPADIETEWLDRLTDLNEVRGELLLMTNADDALLAGITYCA